MPTEQKAAEAAQNNYQHRLSLRAQRYIPYVEFKLAWLNHLYRKVDKEMLNSPFSKWCSRSTESLVKILLPSTS